MDLEKSEYRFEGLSCSDALSFEELPTLQEAIRMADGERFQAALAARMPRTAAKQEAAALARRVIDEMLGTEAEPSFDTALLPTAFVGRRSLEVSYSVVREDGFEDAAAFAASGGTLGAMPRLDLTSASWKRALGFRVWAVRCPADEGCPTWGCEADIDDFLAAAMSDLIDAKDPTEAGRLAFLGRLARYYNDAEEDACETAESMDGLSSCHNEFLPSGSDPRSIDPYELERAVCAKARVNAADLPLRIDLARRTAALARAVGDDDRKAAPSAQGAAARELAFMRKLGKARRDLADGKTCSLEDFRRELGFE